MVSDLGAEVRGPRDHHGVTYRDHTTVDDVSIGDDGVRVRLAGGAEIGGRFVIDAAGRSSILARTLGLRESPCRLRHASRTIFTHMRGVVPFESVAPEATRKRRTASWSHGTLHHVFDQGWFWIIPFDNHASSTSDLVSVGLTLDLDRHPRPADMEPDAARDLQSARDLRACEIPGSHRSHCARSPIAIARNHEGIRDHRRRDRRSATGRASGTRSEMQLTTLVDILEAEIPGLTERASTRENLARLYTERGRRDDAAAVLRGTPRGTPRAGTRRPSGSR